MRLKHQRSIRIGRRGKESNTGEERNCMDNLREKQKSYQVSLGVG